MASYDLLPEAASPENRSRYCGIVRLWGSFPHVLLADFMTYSSHLDPAQGMMLRYLIIYGIIDIKLLTTKLKEFYPEISIDDKYILSSMKYIQNNLIKTRYDLIISLAGHEFELTYSKGADNEFIKRGVKEDRKSTNGPGGDKQKRSPFRRSFGNTPERVC